MSDFLVSDDGLIEKKRGTKERKSFLRREVEGTSASINDRLCVK